MGRIVSILQDLQQLPRFSDGWTFLYTEKVRIERDDGGIVLTDAEGHVSVPVAALSVLLLGPGAAITHAAVVALAEGGCSIVWCGEQGTKFYASGIGETRKSGNLMAQAEAWADEKKRLDVVKRLYRMRFPVQLDPGLTLEQIRGMEGVRVREAYARASRETGVPWSGRSYQRGDWSAADPVNRALSTANACLYGLCHAAIVATGFSPALGFLHTGKQLSFVYDVADLYKMDVSVPVAFQVVTGGTSSLESRVRRLCRAAFYRRKLVERIVPDIQRALGLKPEVVRLISHGAPELTEGDAPGGLWDPMQGVVAGGQNYAGDGGGEAGPEGDTEEEVPF